MGHHDALAAAAPGIHDTDRTLHSMHAYFVTAARTDEPVHYDVATLRDSRSFTIRQVTAHQAGTQVLTLTASAHVAETSHWQQRQRKTMPPGPDIDADRDPSFEHDIGRTLRTVSVPGSAAGAHRAWLRTRVPPASYSPVGPAALAYMADSVLSIPSISRAGADPGLVPSASLDFAMWFHRTAPDEWLLFDSTCSTFGGSRGLSLLEICRTDGTLVASATQEVLVRHGGG